MGFFKSEPKICLVCGRESGTFSGYNTVNGDSICGDCFKLCGGNLGFGDLNDINIKNIVNFINDKKERMNEWEKYNSTDKVGNLFEMSDGAQMIRIAKDKRDQSPDYFLFSELIDYELIEDGQAITKGGLGSAVVGGLLLGGTGAIVGGITGGKKTKQEIKEMYIKISLKNNYFPQRRIKLITYKVMKNDNDYKNAKQNADKIMSLLKLVDQKNGGNTSNEGNAVSGADEILKYKNLLDMGAITQEEFDKKKKQLLDL